MRNDTDTRARGGGGGGGAYADGAGLALKGSVENAEGGEDTVGLGVAQHTLGKRLEEVDLGSRQTRRPELCFMFWQIWIRRLGDWVWWGRVGE